MADYATLPDDLPAPLDDGAARHLTGTRLPSVALPATTGKAIDLSALPGRTIVFAYPMTGIPGVALPEGWNDIPGARGCTPQTQAFQDRRPSIELLGASVIGLSTQTPAYQQELSDRLDLSFPMLSDAAFTLTDTLGLPTMVVDGMRLLKRLTMIVREGAIEHVIYPVFPPDKAADAVIAWLGAAAAGRMELSSGIIRIYTLPGCRFCKAGKELLEARGVAFEEIGVGDDLDTLARVTARTGRRTFPQAFVGAKFIGGYDDLEMLDARGELGTSLPA